MKSVMYSFLHKCEITGYPVALISAVWLLVSSSWLAALVGVIALFFGSDIFLILLLPMVYFFSHAIKWKVFMLWLFVLTYMTLLIALWGYCVFKFIVIPGQISIPSILLGYVVATKILLSLAKVDLQSGNYNMCCFAIFSQIAFVSAVVFVITLQKINGPIISSYLITGLMTIIALIVVWPMGEGYSDLNIAKVFLQDF